LIVGQLFVSGVIVLLLDELSQQGYGLGSGISLFIGANISGAILWNSLSFSWITAADGSSEIEGALLAFFQLLYSKSNKFEAIKLAFTRSYAPNLMSLISTFVVLLVVLYV
jgi:protein transport protein SEC61 subunit alpha